MGTQNTIDLAGVKLEYFVTTEDVHIMFSFRPTGFLQLKENSHLYSVVMLMLHSLFMDLFLDAIHVYRICFQMHSISTDNTW